MSHRPRLLDLFCGAGGAAKGYYDAGFEVVGVDINPQRNYPYEFHQADAMTFPLDGFDAIHASPPCQSYSAATRHLSDGTAPKLVDDIRDRMRATDRPWVIENVEGSPLATFTNLFGDHGVKLCGTEFGLRIWRHRLFETSFPVQRRSRCRHDRPPINPHREESRQRMREEFGNTDLELVWRTHAGVDWMSRMEGRQAIPPAYTRWIGRQLIDIL